MSLADRIANLLETAEDQVGRQAGFLLAWVSLLWVIEAVDFITPWNLDQWGIRPRDWGGLTGIPLAPFLHGGFGHLASNSLTLVALAWIVIAAGWDKFWMVTGVTTVVTGLAVWLTGRPDSVHIGASFLIFGYLGFLLAHGIFRRSLLWIVIALGVGGLYGSLIGGVLPTGDTKISWEGHLFGLLSGILAAWMAGDGKPRDAAEPLQ